MQFSLQIECFAIDVHQMPNSNRTDGIWAILKSIGMDIEIHNFQQHLTELTISQKIWKKAMKCDSFCQNLKKNLDKLQTNQTQFTK